MFFTTNSGTGKSSQNVSFSYTGIALSLLRNRIAPEGTTTETSIMQQAQARGAKVWSTPWSPPAAMKSNTNVNNGGTLLTASYPAYATQLANYVLSMKNTYGINLQAISVQNEPTTLVSYESCIWTAQQIHDFVPYLYNALVSNGVSSTKILLPECESWNFALASTTMNDTNTAAMVGVLGCHAYSGAAAAVNSYGKALWETEDSNLSGSDTSIANAVGWAKKIHDFMTVAEVNAWHFWWLIPYQGNGGLCDTNSVPTLRMYTIGQFSRFVRPGYCRMGVTNSGSLYVSAYKDTNSPAFAIVAINDNASSSELRTFNLASFAATNLIPWITSGSQTLAQQTPVTVINSSFSYTIPAMSVVTFAGLGTATNNPPVADAQSVTTTQNVSRAITLTGSDIDVEALTYAIVAAPAHGSLSGTAPNVTYTPAANYSGSDAFTFKASDGAVSSTVATVSITVVPVGLPGVDNASGAISQGATSATLQGALTTGLMANAWICWGEQDGGTASTSAWDRAQAVGAVSQGVVFTAPATGLATNHSYFYRCFISNTVGQAWSAAAASFSGTPVSGGGITSFGGSITNYASNGTNFTAHIFTNSGTFTVQASGNVEVLVVGGGGGGGSRHGGGGGAGGLIFTNVYPVVGGSNYTVTVGVGGAGNPNGSSVQAGSPGSNSVFGNGAAALISFGGGYGGATIGGPGGSGGGGGYSGGAGGASTNGQGFKGGTGSGSYAGRGGGGAGGQGVDGGGVDGSNGGPGANLDISGTATWYAGGGGGGSANNVKGTGGSGIGGDGGQPGSITGGAGAVNTGSGGGGGGGGATGSGGGNGGAGIVIVRYVANGRAIRNLAPSGIKGSAASLNAALLAPDTNYAVTAYWGAADGGTNADAWDHSAPVGSWTNAGSTNITCQVSGLSGSTTCYYTFRAVNAETNVWAQPSWQFTTRTMPTAPAVGNQSSTPSGNTSAMLSGMLTAGQEADAWICWGDHDGGISSSAWDHVQSVGAVDEGVAFATSVAGLATNQTYFYRCFVINAAGQAWSASASSFNAMPVGGSGLALTNSGGTVTDYTLNGTNFTAHIFTSSGTFTVGASGKVEVLVVAGGGGGGGAYGPYGSGGGGGGLIYSNAYPVVAGSNYTITVGSGGAGNNSGAGANGANSVFGSLTALGGGGGSGQSGSQNGNNGGSGGGGYNGGIAGTGLQPGSTSGGYGHNGSVGNASQGGGGGGAGTNLPTGAGGGGYGLAFSLSGASVYYAGGGNGNWSTTVVPGGGGIINAAGAANTGGGGGGASGGNPGSGGSGIVIVRYVAGGGSCAIQNLPPTGITTNAASLNAALSVASTSCAVTVYWGTTDGGTNAGAWTYSAAVGSWTNVAVTNLAYQVSGLSGLTSYYYAFSDSNAGAKVWATPSWQFTTLGTSTGATCTLTVSSVYGTPSPSGVTTPASNSVVSASMLNSPVISGPTQVVCTGWIGTGSLASGSGSSTSFTITNDTTITWQWQTNYWIGLGTSGSGMLSQASAWCTAGTNLIVNAAPGVSSVFDSWLGDTNGASIAGTQITFAVNAPRNITARFLPIGNRAPVVSAGTNQTVYLAAAGWSPTSVSPLAWYDAADAATIVQSGGTVSQWNDKSGHGRNVAQAIATNQPAYSVGAVSFDGTNDYLWSSSPFMWTNGQVDVYLVATVNAATDARLVAEAYSLTKTSLYSIVEVHNTNQSMMCAFIRNSTNATLFNHQALSPAGAFDNTEKIYQWSDTATNLSGRVNGGTETSIGYSRSGMLLLDRFSIGALLRGSASAYALASIREIVITSKLSDADRMALEGCLAQKWSLATNLPPGHPYKDSAPGAMVVSLDGTVSDVDGDPLTTVWSVVSGPASVALANSNAVDTSASFSTAGSYVLRLTADDGFTQTSSDITITVVTNLAPQYTLTVVSAHGTPSPAGVTTSDWNTVIHPALIDSPVVNTLTQYVCTGWIGAGSLASGAGTNTSFTITNNTTITWQWQTNCWIDFSVIAD